MPIPNDTVPLLLDAGYLHGAHLALVHRDGPLIPTPPRRGPARPATTPAYRLTASTTRLRCAVNLAISCLRTGRISEALDVLETV